MDVITIKEVRNDVLYLIKELREIDKDKAIRSGLYSGGAILKRGGCVKIKITHENALRPERQSC